tara:strand:+ start:623 stop:1009 length:387 start_codon:yes stop_codon:yes gene_type:complete
MAKKTIKAPAKKKVTSVKKAPAKKTTPKKTLKFDVNKDGIVDEKDVELVKKAAAKPKPKEKKSAFSDKDKKRFKNKTNRLGVRMNDVQIACEEIFGEKAKVVLDKSNVKCYHIEIAGEKFPEIGIFSI